MPKFCLAVQRLLDTFTRTALSSEPDLFSPCKVVLKLGQGPHVARDFVESLVISVCPIFQLFGNRVVRQVREEVAGGRRVVVITAETKVALPVGVDLEGIPRRNNDPHPDIELPIHDQHGTLDVLLDHPGLLCV